MGEKTKLIEEIERGVDGDYHYVRFAIPLNPEMTVERAVNAVKRIFTKVEEVMMKMIVKFYESRLAAWKGLMRGKRG